MTCKVSHRPSDATTAMLSEDLSNRSSCTTTSRSSSISFGTIQVREYNRVVGEEFLDVSNALAIGWEFAQLQAMPLEEFEKLQQVKIDQALQKQWDAMPATMKYKLRMNVPSGPPKLSKVGCERRKRILASFGYTSQELKQAEKERKRKLSGLPAEQQPKSLATRVMHKLMKPLKC